MDTDFQYSLDKLRREYTGQIAKKKEILLSIITHYRQKFINSGGETVETDFSESVEKLLGFDELSHKLLQLDSTWSKYSRIFGSCAHEQRKKINPPLREAYKYVADLKEEVRYLQNFIHGKLKDIMTAIENCPRGKQGAVDFQKAVCSLSNGSLSIN